MLTRSCLCGNGMGYPWRVEGPCPPGSPRRCRIDLRTRSAWERSAIAEMRRGSISNVLTAFGQGLRRGFLLVWRADSDASAYVCPGADAGAGALEAVCVAMEKNAYAPEGSRGASLGAAARTHSRQSDGV